MPIFEAGKRHVGSKGRAQTMEGGIGSDFVPLVKALREVIGIGKV